MLNDNSPNENDIFLYNAGAMAFIRDLTIEFRDELKVLLDNRTATQIEYNNGKKPNFLEETKHIRESEWNVAEIPSDIKDRRVEITGPVDRKMIINALNSGANIFMADFEDSLSPSWKNILNGQLNLYEAVRKTISYEHPIKGTYTLVDEPAVLFVRPRGLHLYESHFTIDDVSVPACLFDFGLYMYHNARYLVENGQAPYFYLPKIEHYTEARWWNSVFNWTQERLGIPTGTFRATVLLETLPASFQMDEILWELKYHSAGLNCGRWDYIFSYIKTFRNDSSRVLPDRGSVTMESHFMRKYSERVIQVCHRRNIHAIGGMAAQIPIRGDEKANKIALDKVRADKEREVKAGHDGTWVAHPGLINLTREIFDKHMSTDNQIDKKVDYDINQNDLIQPPDGEITEEGLKQNIDVGIKYLYAWLNGIGCVPLYNLMEDAATAEISRTQVWQWIKHKAQLKDTRIVDKQLVSSYITEVVNKEPELKNSADIFAELCFNDKLVDFLTLPAYEKIRIAA